MGTMEMVNSITESLRARGQDRLTKNSCVAQAIRPRETKEKDQEEQAAALIKRCDPLPSLWT